ncbi:MAG: hypothetical protein HZA61_02380 [Candidatus Eisenbacteria bacterium]|uniref:Uncharacterized protein n=1 Tax=Eiseniibacteriota bacterium TaxID=2212470 RepID=A0A933W9F3_UNCEI|nr:hypothetical protein [Candidatus Eisenbacteria bacterium]
MHLACDGCEAAAWTGPAPAGGFDAWCERCQSAHAADSAAAACPACGSPLATGTPRFVELWGRLQMLDGALRAWDGEPEPLARLLPMRPRFVSDLTPPAARPGDPDPLAALLEAVRTGRWGDALAVADLDGDPRAHAALAIARERRGETALAAGEWTRALESGEWEQARLARGSLRARAADGAGAAADFALAGTSAAARWNRASLAVHQALAKTPGAPEQRAIAAARAEAGEAPEFWSEPTVGRLAWDLLAERTLARREAGEFTDFDLHVLREAEDLFEHATFWDRAMVLVTYSRLELHGDVSRVAMPAALALASELLAEPAVKGEALAPFAASVTAAYDAAHARDPRRAWRALYLWMRDERLQRYRLPCAACRRGSIGVDGFAGEEPGDESRGG